MALKEYKRKRNFDQTPEPTGGQSSPGNVFRFVVQKHDASRLHYDFRLEWNGVLLSWAVPKGPSLNPKNKHLAVKVEDHPLDYADFEGTIPEGQYGGGTVMLWDRGTWTPQGDPKEQLTQGNLKIWLEGEKLRGGFALIRMKGKGENNWLLIKEKDEFVETTGKEIVERLPKSVKTGRSLDAIATETQLEMESLPAEVSPQLATLVHKIPEGDEWIHEIKLDGYRILAYLENGKCRLMTRGGKNWTKKFATVRDELNRKYKDFTGILDGEIVVQGTDGRTDFQALQNAIKTGGKGMRFFVFDLLYIAGRNVMQEVLIERKRLLNEVLTAHPSNIVVPSEHIDGNGGEVLEHACTLKVEGIVSKRKDSVYTQARTRSWVKVKCIQRQEFVVAGYTDPKNSRTGFGALLLGHLNGRELVYAGRVGTGFDEELLKSLHARLKKLESSKQPFESFGEPTRGIHWVKPELVAEVEFLEWTDDGVLRHPSFKGLREDKPAKEVRKEIPREVGAMPKPSDSGPVAGVILSNPDKVLYPGQGVTKLELARFYESIAQHALTWMTERPLAIVRCPMGHKKTCFFQKHSNDTLPDAIHGMEIDEGGEASTCVYIRDLEGLVSLVQLGVLEIHTWGCRIDKPEKPDLMVFDLDPAEGLGWKQVREGALELRATLKDLGLVSFLKTSGGKGLHIMVPLDRRSEWEDFKAFSKAVAERLAKSRPDRYVATMSKAKRKGKIFIDYLRNGRGATCVAAYSTRAREGAPVSTPIGWDELDTIESARQFNVRNLPDRLARLKVHPWKDMRGTRQSLTAPMRKELGL